MLEREREIKEDSASLSSVVDRALADFWSRESFTTEDFDGSEVQEDFSHWTAGAEQVNSLLESGQNPVGLFFRFIEEAKLTADDIVNLEVFRAEPTGNISDCFTMLLEEIVQLNMEQKDPKILKESRRRMDLYDSPSDTSQEELNEYMDNQLERVGLARITPRTS